MKKTTANHLETAIDVLTIQDVWQAAASSELSAEMFTRLDFPGDFQLEYRHQVIRTILGEPEQGQVAADRPVYIFRVQLEMGVRYIEVPRRQKKKKKSSRARGGAEPHVLAVIEASYFADYRCEKNPGDEALEAFAHNNASFHVWPFWREFVASQANRMNLPKPTLPLLRLRPIVPSTEVVKD